MNEALTLLLAGLAGGSLGAIFFGGLWWTVRKGLTANQPVFWFVGSMLLRTGIVLFGFYFVANHHIGRLAPCFLGFAMARFVVMQITRPARESRHAQETPHAP